MEDYRLNSRVGVFSGTFDPIHLGHLNLATIIKEQEKLDRIIFSPVHQSPGKQKPYASAQERVQMVSLAIEGHRDFSCDEWESKQTGESFTILLIEYLQPKYPQTSLFLLMSEDLYLHVSSWKNYDALTQKAHFLVGKRSSSSHNMQKNTNATYIDMPIMEISSSLIRSKIKEKKSCQHLLSPKVLDFIHKNQLYL